MKKKFYYYMYQQEIILLCSLNLCISSIILLKLDKLVPKKTLKLF